MNLSRSLITIIAAFLLALCALVLPAISVQAGPPAPTDIVLTQPDGTQISARPWGDEWQNGLETLDGYTLLFDEASGYWVYAERQPDGQLAPALEDGRMLRAGIDAPGALPLQARPEPVERPALQPQAEENPALRSFLSSESSGITPEASIRDQKLLVVLVEFLDEKSETPATTFRDQAFGSSDSIKDYYAQASSGLLNYLPAEETDTASGEANDGVVGWLQLPLYHPDPLTLSENISRMLAREALRAAGDYVNFKTFDTNGDGYVTNNELHILIIAAGCEASSTCPPGEPKIWAHQFTLDGYLVKVDDVYVAQSSPNDPGGYVIVSERHYDWMYRPYAATIGVMVHELGHLLGWPDLYDTSYLTNGVGKWSIMGGGSWNNAPFGKPGSSPALPDAWLKWYQGWITPQTSLPLSAIGPEILLFGSNPNGVDWVFERRSGVGEYWLLERRQQEGYDKGLPGSGLLLWHIDESAPFNNDANNTYINPRHRLVALEQADGLDDLYFARNRGDSGDPFPGAANQLTWGPFTKPGSAYNNGMQSALSLSFIPNGEPNLVSLRLEEVQIFQTFMPAVNKQMITGRLTSNGVPVAGQKVAMSYTTNRWVNYSDYATTTSDASGNFSLPIPPLTTSQHEYQLYWINTSSNPSWLSSFYANVASSLTPNKPYEINLANMNLISPPNGASVAMPTTFVWTRRTTVDDSYGLGLTNESGTLFSTITNLGYTDRFTISGLPYWVMANTRYYWFTLVKTTAGWGYSFWMNSIYFRNLAGPALDGAPLAGWVSADTMGISPNPALMLQRIRPPE